MSTSVRGVCAGPLGAGFGRSSVVSTSVASESAVSRIVSGSSAGSTVSVVSVVSVGVAVSSGSRNVAAWLRSAPLGGAVGASGSGSGSASGSVSSAAGSSSSGSAAGSDSSC